ncbi:MAG: hypothetical protein KZQ58_03560 [gamma proteobacterium symbiont of Bathyaustriella thionipta]|nr:hypothetical protein [gamma proteobacterium symbiont of Bathyaustriella thionipta]
MSVTSFEYKNTMRTLTFIFTFLFYLLTYAESDPPFADKVLVKKEDRKMFLLKDGNAYREYHISLGDMPKGHKQQEGDEKTPEGK